MSHLHRPLNIIESTNISPPDGTVSSTTLPLTFLDTQWLTLPLSESLFFFSYQNSTESFLKDFLPNLKQSLSFTLQHFFPYSGNLIIPPRPHPPYLRYTDGEDSLVFTVAECIGTDFNDLKTDCAKDIRVLHDLLPKLPHFHTMAIQVTIFSGAGICIGNTSTHVAGDGVTFTHFMKYWMSLTNISNGGDPTILLPSLPIHSCRDAIKDPGQVSDGCLEQFWSQNSQNENRETHMVRETFTMRRKQIEKLRLCVTHHSTIAVTLAIVWVSFIKTQFKEAMEDDEHLHLVFGVDCRNRLTYKDHVPSNYFGNCIIPGFVSVKKQDLVGENGVLAASNAITAKIKELLTSNITETTSAWRQDITKWSMSRFPVSVAGSPKLCMYDLDFGLGKPCKVEIVHIETGGAIAFFESRDGNNGVEIGLVLSKKKMETFSLILQQEINKFQM